MPEQIHSPAMRPPAMRENSRLTYPVTQAAARKPRNSPQWVPRNRGRMATLSWAAKMSSMCA
jgi:hypothetical protein